MAKKYKLSDSGIFDTENNLSIPVDDGNRHYNKYLIWVADGNTPDAPDPPPVKDKKKKVKDFLSADNPTSNAVLALIEVCADKFGISKNEMESLIEAKL